MESLITKKMRFPPRDIDCRAVVPFQIGDVKHALKHVIDFDICIQAGGNVGYWPLYLSDIFKKVYTFEPDQQNYDCFLENVDVPNVFIEQKALGHIDGVRGSLDGDLRNCGAYQIVEDGDDFEMTTVDALSLPSCGFLCLDIEGYELHALVGARDTIVEFSPVIMLEDKGLSDRYGSKKGDVEIYLEQFGYEVVHRIHRDVILVKFGSNNEIRGAEEAK